MVTSNLLQVLLPLFRKGDWHIVNDKAAEAMSAYTATAAREGRWWVIDVDGVGVALLNA
jgi:hypothetical protein